jgi:hypothetical protein
VDADRVLRLLVKAIFGLRSGLGLIARECQLAGGQSVSAKFLNGSSRDSGLADVKTGKGAA